MVLGTSLLYPSAHGGPGLTRVPALHYFKTNITTQQPQQQQHQHRHRPNDSTVGLVQLPGISQRQTDLTAEIMHHGWLMIYRGDTGGGGGGDEDEDEDEHQTRKPVNLRRGAIMAITRRRQRTMTILSSLDMLELDGVALLSTISGHCGGDVGGRS